MTEDKLQRIEGYGLFFGLVGKLIYAFPDKAMLASLVEEDVFAEFPVESENPDFVRGSALLCNWTAAYASAPDPQEAFSQIRVDATRLFAGYQSIDTPPWESVYFNKERMIFQEQTLDVRRWYGTYGLQLVQKNHEPDDHIGLELDFIAHVLGLALESEDAQRADELIADAVRFACEHPAAWAKQWAESVDREARTDYYRGLALVAVAVLEDFVAEFSGPKAEA